MPCKTAITLNIVTMSVEHPRAEKSLIERERDRLAAEHNDPFSDSSGWASPALINALLDEISDRRKPPQEVESANAELAARVQLHVSVKAQLLQHSIAENADMIAGRLTRATRLLAFATFALVAATVALVVVSAKG